MNQDWTALEKKSLIEQLADSATALVCNALDFLGIEVPYMDETVRCLTPGLPPLVGEAVTIRLDSSTPGSRADPELYYRMLEELSQSDIPKVVVVQTVGLDRRKECVAGDGMAKTMLSVGVLGLVTDGGIRDIRDIINQGFKVFGLGHVVQHTPLVWSGLYEPVQLGGITVRTGDIVHGDVDGVILVPRESWGKIAKACQVALDFEKKAHVVLRQSGIPIPVKREKVTQFWQEAANEIKGGGSD
jgi:4-hydroxy-4-methyl-2-oxoglutarate aldolase